MGFTLYREVSFLFKDDQNPKEHIENKIYEFRVMNKITQSELSKSVGVSRQTIIALEKQHYTPSLMLGLKIANFFNVSVEDIFQLKVRGE